jgi:hypothetical protein
MKTVLMVLVVAGCALSSGPRTIILPSTAYGRTTCIDGKPISVQVGGLPEGDSIEVDAHEYRHQQQMAGQCQSFLKRFSEDEAFRIRMEMDAYCYGIRTRPDSTQAARREQLLGYAKDHSTLPVSEIRRIFDEVCP